MKDIVSLRNHLFEQLDRLAEALGEDLDKEVRRAASIVQVSESIIKSAEVENEFISITKAFGSGFIPVIGTGKKGILEILKEQLVIKEEQAKINSETGIFDETKEKNWLIDDGKPEPKKQIYDPLK